MTLPSKPHVRLMLDSGSYTACGKNATIDLDAYIAFIEANKQWLWQYVNLDVIPSRPHTPAQLEASAKQSYDNLQFMKDAGLSPIPVFHQGEAFSWLEKLLADREPYIGISTDKNLFPKAQRKFLDQAFEMLIDKQGQPIVKTHGFGITSVDHMLRYPFTSVDSTTWAMAAGFGKIFVPYVNQDGGYDYARSPLEVIMSGRKQRSTEVKPFATLRPSLQEHVKGYLAEIGISIPQARYDGQARRRALLHYFTEFEKTRSDLTIVFATHPLNRGFSRLLNETKVNCRLVSYWELRHNDPELLRTYVATGSPPEPKRVSKRRLTWDDTSYTKHRQLALEQRINADDQIVPNGGRCDFEDDGWLDLDPAVRANHKAQYEWLDARL
jgi:hypothetical protein